MATWSLGYVAPQPPNRQAISPLIQNPCSNQSFLSPPPTTRPPASNASNTRHLAIFSPTPSTPWSSPPTPPPALTTSGQSNTSSPPNRASRNKKPPSSSRPRP